jgi:hypothetical protein
VKLLVESLKVLLAQDGKVDLVKEATKLRLKQHLMKAASNKRLGIFESAATKCSQHQISMARERASAQDHANLDPETATRI